MGVALRDAQPKPGARGTTMKAALILLLALSALLNGVLGWWWFAGCRTPPPASAAVAAAPAPPAAPPELDAAIWSSFEAPEPSDRVARLRAAGFPNEIVRAILKAQFEEEFNARSRQLNPAADRQPFWKDRPPNPEAQVTLARLRRDHQRTLRALFGDEEDSVQLMKRAFPGRRLDGLPTEKAAAVLEVVREFEERRNELYADPRHALDPERTAAFQRAQRDALARVLTPAELEEYELRNSSVAMALRIQLAAFEPTEDEFRALFRLRQEFGDRYGFSIPPGASAEQMRLRSEAQRLLIEQSQRVLGTARAEEYTRKTDFGYMQTSKVVARLELPPDTTDRVFAVQSDISARARAVTADRSLPEESRGRQLAALREEATARLTPMLGGSRGFEAYRQYSGTWLEGLRPRSTGTKTGP